MGVRVRQRSAEPGCVWGVVRAGVSRDGFHGAWCGLAVWGGALPAIILLMKAYGKS